MKLCELRLERCWRLVPEIRKGTEAEYGNAFHPFSVPFATDEGGRDGFALLFHQKTGGYAWE